jgi:hypothetical protein
MRRPAPVTWVRASGTAVQVTHRAADAPWGARTVLSVEAGFYFCRGVGEMGNSETSRGAGLDSPKKRANLRLLAVRTARARKH